MASDDSGSKPTRRRSLTRRARTDNTIETLGVGKSLLLAAGALALAAIAVCLFILLASAVGCRYQPAVFSLFAGVVLTAFVAVLGGWAAIRTHIAKFGTAISVGGGAAFLLIVLGAVYWATNSPCELTPTVRLMSIPSEAVPSDTPAQPVYARMRFSRELDIQDDLDNKQAYNIQIRPGGELTMHVELIKGDTSIKACSIAITRPSQRKVDKGFFKQKKDIIEELAADENGVYDLHFRQAFVTEMAKKPFAAKKSTPNNACIDAPVWGDKYDISWIPINEIYIYSPTLLERTQDFFNTWSFSKLKGERQIWATKLPEAEAKDAPAPSTPATVQLPATKPEANCRKNDETSPAQKALRTLLSDGFIGDAETRSLYEGWCEVEEKFYQALQEANDTSQSQLIRFIRSSITGIDICWSASEAYRKKNYKQATQCIPALNLPRKLARALPFATKPEHMGILVGFLSDNSVAVRREVDGLLRSYPHDVFATAFKEKFAAWNPIPLETRQAIALAAVGYYYNRIVEQQYSPADQLESAWKIASDEITDATYWIDKLSPPDRAAARARLDYARAHVVLKVTNDNPPPFWNARVRTDFQQLISLNADEILAYPLPGHITRAFAYQKGTANDRQMLAQINSDKLQGRSGRSVRVDTITDDSKLFVVPNIASTTPLAAIGSADSVRVLFRLEGAVEGKPEANKSIWEFVSTPNSGLGWVKRTKN